MQYEPRIMNLKVGELVKQRVMGGAMRELFVASLFYNFCAQDEHSEEHVAFLADIAHTRLSAASALTGLARFGKTREPADKTAGWADPHAVGLYERYVVENQPFTINISYTLRKRLHEAYQEGKGTSVRAPKLLMSVYDEALKEVLIMVNDAFGRFTTALNDMQTRVHGGQQAFLGQKDALRELAGERRHTAEKIRRDTGGQFVIYPLAGDKKPLLQVSAELGREVSPDRVVIAKKLTLEVPNPIVKGIWAKGGNNGDTLLVQVTSGDQTTGQALFAAALQVSGLTSLKVKASTEKVIQQAAQVGRGLGSAINDKLRPTPQQQQRKTITKEVTGKGLPSPRLLILNKQEAMGKDKPEEVVAEAQPKMRQFRSSLIQAVTRALAMQIVKTRLQQLDKQGTGKYWLCLWTDPNHKGKQLAVAEVWLFRGLQKPTAPRTPHELPKSQWALILSTEWAELRAQDAPAPAQNPQ